MGIILWVLVGLIISVVVLIYVLLFGQSDFHRDGCVGRANRFVTGELPGLFGRVIQTVCGGPVYRCWTRFEIYCFYSRNPFLQIFYLLLVFIGLGIFLVVAYPRLPLHHQIGAWVIVSTTLSLFAKACYSDPGEIKHSNLNKYLPNYQFDGLLYVPKKCYTCEVDRPARSKHCKLCNKCVARYDHHCPWINNCVGANNVRWFLLFLFFTWLTCMYCVYDGVWIFWYDVIVRYRLLELRFGNAPLSTTMVLQYTLYYGGAGLFGLTLFTLFSGIAVIAFLGYHLLLVIRNTTTVESIKWSYANKLWKRQRIYRQELQVLVDCASNQMLGYALPEGEQLLCEPVNIYHRGLSENLKEAFFPICERNPPTVQPLPEKLKQIADRDQQYENLIKHLPRRSKAEEQTISTNDQQSLTHRSPDNLSRKDE